MRKLVICLLLVIASQAYARSLQDIAPEVAAELGQQLLDEKCPKVTCLDLFDIQGRQNELGRFIADQLAVKLVKIDGITVVDRANIDAIMDEQKLTREGLVKPENAKKLGEFSGIDALITGTLTMMDGQVQLTLNAVSTETSITVASASAEFSATEDIQRMLGTRVERTGLSGAQRPATASRTSSSTEPSARQGDALASVEVGPLVATLRNVTNGYYTTEAGTKVPFIRCTVELENPSLHDKIAVAGNARAYISESSNASPQTWGFRGAASDSNGQSYDIPTGGLLGVSAVFNFEIIDRNSPNYYFAQPKPTSIVISILRGTRFKYAEGLPYGDYWTGGFGSVAAGKKIRLTATYVPSWYNRTRRTSSDKEPEYVVPETFQMDLELVMGIWQQDEAESDVPKNLVLRNLTFDQVYLGKKGK